MKFFIYMIALISSLFACSCKDGEATVNAERENTHEVIIDDYQQTQLKFNRLVRKIRDTKSYDLAAPRLEEIVVEFERLSSELKKLDPPNTELSKSMRRQIEKGNKASEPTGEDISSLMSVEGRGEQVQIWLKTFVSSGQKIGRQFTRLYTPKNKEKDD
ncbi:MAG: hypothetical protein QMC23_04675 [Rubritalea sp.]